MDEDTTNTNIDDTSAKQPDDSSVFGKDENEPSKMEDNGRNADGTFKEGWKGGPGRPKGMSMKEFARQRFKFMDYDEKIAFIEALPPDLVWRMGEGNPATDNKTELTGAVVINVSKEGAEKYGLSTSGAGDDIEGQA